MERWASVDKQLCRVVDQLRMMGYCHTLKVEIRLTKISEVPGELDFTMFLPEFREKGVVTVIDVAHSDRVLHSSAYIC